MNQCQTGTTQRPPLTKWPAAALLLLGSTGAFAAQQVAAGAPADLGFVELNHIKTLERVCRDTQLPGVTGPAGHGDVVQRRLDEATRQQARKDALERVYVARFNSTQFQFSDYDPAEGRLSIETRNGFFALRGGLGLWSVQGEPLEVVLPPGQAQEVAQAKAQGTLGLVLYVHLDAEPEDVDEQDTLKGQPCSTRPASDAYKLGVLWLGGELTDIKTGRRFARFATEHGRSTPRLAQRLLGDATMEIRNPDGAGTAAGDVLKAMEAQRQNLHGCYVKHGDHAEGGMVLGLDTDSAGTVKNVGIDVASLDNEELAQCLAGTVKGTSLGGRTLANAHVSVPLVWGRAD